jgi:hypothetical protein
MGRREGPRFENVFQFEFCVEESRFNSFIELPPVAGRISNGRITNILFLLFSSLAMQIWQHHGPARSVVNPIAPAAPSDAAAHC